MNPTRRNQLVAAAFAGVMGLVLVLVSVGGDNSAGDAPSITTSETSTTEPPPAGGGDRTPSTGVARTGAEVPALDCKTLLTSDRVDEGLGVWDRPPGERSSFGYASGEVCSDVLVVDDRVLVGISPGDPDDFGPGARLLGVGGEPVIGVGEAGLWFGGEGAEGGGAAGVLSVRQPTNLGVLYFRLSLGRPDLDSSAQLELAKKLASSVLLRFPGVEEPAAPIPVDVDFAAAFEEEEVDRSELSFVDNLLVKEEAGEWTRGQGLVSTLELFVGEADTADVLRHPEVLEKEGTGVVAMAYEYLEDGSDAELRAEIARLLDLLVFTNDRLEAMAGISPVGDAEASQGVAVRVALPLAPPLAQQTVKACQDFFNQDVYGSAGPGIGPCLEWRPANVSADLDPGKYRVFIPAPSFPQGSWTGDHYDLALTALEHSARWYEGEGRRLAKAAGAKGMMPSVNVVFAVSGGGGNLAVATPVAGRSCGVALYQSLQTESANNFEQTVAHELAHCFQTENFPEQNDPKKVKYEVREWREEGLADYLSGVVYPQNNQEWDSLSRTARINSQTTLLDLSYGNFLFFQYLEEKIGLEAIFRLVGTLPTGGDRKDQEERLAAFTGMDDLFHEYAEAMIDGEVEDTGGGLVGKPPYKMKYRTKAITGTGEATLDLKPFGLSRLQITVEECKNAKFAFDWGTAKDSARPAAGREWFAFPNSLPESSGDERDRIYVISVTEDQAVSLEVTDFKDDPECEDGSTSPLPPPEPCPLDCPPSLYYR